jgi:catechol 2,3-dioxygenase-like lactoylglutathione lyase family enzyme
MAGAYDPPVSDEDLERMVPVLSVRSVPEVVAFYERLGLHVTADYDGYVILATAPVDDDHTVELHLSQWDDHDPRTTTNTVYLRVRDADALHRRLHDALAAEGRLYLTPASGLTPELTSELQAREDAGEVLTRLSEIADKPWGQREFAVIDPAGTLVRIGSRSTS